jgi:hypothetical protein
MYHKAQIPLACSLFCFMVLRRLAISACAFNTAACADAVGVLVFGEGTGQYLPLDGEGDC